MEEQDASNITGLAALALFVMAYLTWSLPRRFAICPLLVTTCLMPLGQEILVFGLNFSLFRLLLLVGAFRVMVKGEAAKFRWTRLDKLLVWWAAVSVVCGSLSQPSMALFVNRIGDAYNAIGCYFFARCVILDFENVVTSVRALAFVSVPLAILMVVEKMTAHNLLSVFGGVPEITAVREGHLRCQGAFRHPILAGTFGAVQFPLFASLWFYQPKSRRLAAAAILSALVIAITASSSGALMALIVAIGGLLFWNFRRHLRLFRWGVLLTALALAIVMNAPIWYLSGRLSAFTGGEGWHRAWLIDQTIAHFDEWWLFGTTFTAHWGPAGQVIAADPRMMDITNHYVMEGIKGGILRLGLFFAIVIECFRRVGWTLRQKPFVGPAIFVVWAIGVSLFVNCLSFLSITYFDQSVIVFYWLLAMIACIGCPPRRPAAAPGLVESSIRAEASSSGWDAPSGAGSF